VTDTDAYCIYTAPSVEAGGQIQAFFTERIPEMKTEVKPVLQFFPPSPDIYALVHNLITKVTS
jgi:hypothetical protein